MSKKTNNLYEFSEFRLDTEERVLYRGEKPLTLAPKVFDTLEVLVESEGKLVSKEDLMNEIWQDSFVEESNLTQNIYTLRQIFGKRNKFIKTVPRRGYRFSADVKKIVRDSEIEEAIVTADSGDVILAQRTRTHIVEKETIEHEKESIDVPAETLEKKTPFSRKIYLGAFAGILAVAMLGLLGFSYWNKDSSGMDNVPVGKAQFKALTDTGDVTTLAVSPDNRFLAYAVNTSKGERQMRLKDLELNQDVLLKISNKMIPSFLRFSPDGDYIYFLSRDRTENSTNIYKMTRFGGETELITKDIAGEFSFSKDGKKITFVRKDAKTNAHTLFIKNLENSEETEVLKKEFPEGFSLVSSPAFSPSGEKIYVLNNKQKTFFSEVVSINLKTSEETIIKTPKQLKHFVQIESTPKEDEVIVSVRRNGGFGQIYKLSIPDGKVKRITNDLNYYRKISVSKDGKSISALKRLSYSNLWLLPNAKMENAKQLTKGTFGRFGRNGLELLPDGQVAFVSITSGNREVWTLNINDDSKNQLTKHERNVSQNPTAAPNGRHIYYVSGRNRSRNINRMDFDGQNKTPITSDKKSNDLSPAISPDEKKLYFIRKTSGKSAIMQIDLPDGEPQKLNLPEKVELGEVLNISPDGRMLFFQQIPQKESSGGERGGESKRSTSSTIGIISLDGSFSEPKFFDIKTDNQNVRWTPTSDAFDFVQNTPTIAYIKRQNIFSESSPETITEIKDINIRRFLWMPNQKDLLISDFKREQDAVLITDFD